ncbi:MAG: galactokinase family protein [Blastocatellia bacterium]|nr:galactokinase family protein [Blastocatellia bacterium]
MQTPELQPRLDKALTLFRERYGPGEVLALRAPARINILGEHVDYVSYLPTSSLPFGSREHDMLMLFRPTEDGVVRGASTEEAFAPFAFSLDEETIPDSKQQSWESYVFSRAVPAAHWSNYARGAAFFARWKHGAEIRRGLSFLIDSTIPAESGASSSSALVVLTGAAIRRANNAGYRPEELARESAQAEWYLGTRGGALDHLGICAAKAGKAVHISHADQSIELVALPDTRHRWLTFFTHAAAKGGEAMLEYNERAAVSRIIIPAILEDLRREMSWLDDDWNDALGKMKRDLSTACDELESLLGELPESLTLTELSQIHPKAFRECKTAFPTLVRERSEHPLKVQSRALHHLGEVARVTAAVDLLREPKGDATMKALGQLIDSSHESLRDLYEVSTPEVEALIEIVRRSPQVLGARLMGGGFGGSVLVLAKADNAQGLVDLVRKEFYAPRGASIGKVMISTPGDGLAKIDL